MIGPMAKRKRSEHYVNNKEFLAALIRYREDVKIAKIHDALCKVREIEGCSEPFHQIVSSFGHVFAAILP